MLSYDKDETHSVTDLEDFKKKKRVRAANLPLVVEFSLFSENTLLSNEEVERELKKINLLFPKDVQVQHILHLLPSLFSL